MDSSHRFFSSFNFKNLSDIGGAIRLVPSQRPPTLSAKHSTLSRIPWPFRLPPAWFCDLVVLYFLSIFEVSSIPPLVITYTASRSGQSKDVKKKKNLKALVGRMEGNQPYCGKLGHYHTWGILDLGDTFVTSALTEKDSCC